MNEEKPFLNISATVHDLDDIKGLLPDIAALEKKYDVELTISYSPSSIFETKL